jgi:hypothetical protein
LRSGSQRFHEGACFFVNTEQGLDVQAQGGIIGTGFLQVGITLAGGQFQRRVKDDHFTIGRRVHLRLNVPQYDQGTEPQLTRATIFRLLRSHCTKPDQFSEQKETKS